MKNTLIKIIWWTYIFLLFSIVIIKFRGSFEELFIKMTADPFGLTYNLVPFKSIGEQLQHFSKGWAKLNLLGNIIPFLPFGFLLPIAFKNAAALKKVLMLGLIFTVFAETFQFFTKLGSFDIDDIILNMLGIFIGYLLLVVCEAIKT